MSVPEEEQRGEESVRIVLVDEGVQAMAERLTEVMRQRDRALDLLAKVWDYMGEDSYSKTEALLRECGRIK